MVRRLSTRILHFNLHPVSVISYSKWWQMRNLFRIQKSSLFIQWPLGYPGQHYTTVLSWTQVLNQIIFYSHLSFYYLKYFPRDMLCGYQYTASSRITRFNFRQSNGMSAGESWGALTWNCQLRLWYCDSRLGKIAMARSGSISQSKTCNINPKLLEGEKFLKWTDQVESFLVGSARSVNCSFEIG